MEQVREDVRWKVAGAEIHLELSGHDLLIPRAAERKRLYRRLDPPQPTDVGERQRDRAPLSAVELARRERGRRAGRGGGRTTPVPLAPGCQKREHGEYGRENRQADLRHRVDVTGET